MFKRLVVLTALAFSSAAVAHASSINGFLSAAGGTDTFSSSFINFTPNTAMVGGTVGGTFGLYLTNAPINFLTGNLPYSQGAHTTPGGIPIQLFTTAQNGETFAFFLTNYDAAYGAGIPGCVSGDTCLAVTGNGFFTGSGAVAYSQSPATFQFTSQYVPGQTVGSTITSFSASASATGSTVPEPASLALFGTGLLGVVGVARRRFSI
jgi:PEP-CTERM motif